ncbi:zf-MIZ-domain-containing protein [Hypoxylon cercidicola]|nr:zf-MIZ-domain-containing protein [Hypoxylon cercidicola]
MSANPEIRALERIVHTLLNKQLQHICASHGLKTGGVKATLQERIKNALIENYQADPADFNAIRNTIHNVGGGNTGQQNMAPPSGGASQGQGSRGPYYNPYGSYHAGGSGIHPQSHGYGNGDAVANGSAYPGAPRVPHPDKLFKNTPFYTIETRLGHLHTCPVMNNHRNSITVTLKASDYPELSRCAANLPDKVMLFCGSSNTGPQEIEFPHQSEIKVNGEDIKHNLRGLKNKPGSTHPVEITSFLRMKPSYVNNIEFTYALTSKKYYLALYVCKAHSIDDLVTRIKGKKIPKASVIRDISKKANDPDIVATSQKLSLLCPLSCTRLKVPCRGTACNHIQCFDAKYFMQLQEQGPTWSCPICYNPTPFDTLAIDEYVQEVLENTPDSEKKVVIEPDGQWRTETEEHEPSQPRPAVGSSRIDDDDDLSIIGSHGFGSNGNGGSAGGRNALSTPIRSLVASGTPNGDTRGTPSTQRSGSNKRPAEVIDLTLSSDEDDEPIVRAPKRQYLGPSGPLNYTPFSNY